MKAILITITIVLTIFAVAMGFADVMITAKQQAHNAVGNAAYSNAAGELFLHSVVCIIASVVSYVVVNERHFVKK